MHTFADNNLDMKPMLETIQRQSVIYENKRIDMLKDEITLPG